MLLRDTNPSDFRVPSVPRRAVAADDAKAKAERVGEEALRRRDERDANLAAAHERARARSSLFKMFAEEGRPAAGFVRRADDALKRYKASPEALRGDDLKTLERDVRGHAMRLEASARARERVLQAGRTLDTLIAASRTAPQNFAAHAEAARELVERLRLPEKVLTRVSLIVSWRNLCYRCMQPRAFHEVGKAAIDYKSCQIGQAVRLQAPSNLLQVPLCVRLHKVCENRYREDEINGLSFGEVERDAAGGPNITAEVIIVFHPLKEKFEPRVPAANVLRAPANTFLENVSSEVGALSY